MRVVVVMVVVEMAILPWTTGGRCSFWYGDNLPAPAVLHFAIDSVTLASS